MCKGKLKMTLQESLESFRAPSYGKTKRSADTYRTVANHCRSHLTGLVAEYKSVENDQQRLREIRNDMDYYLRRYHEYCIQQRDGMKAHYHEVDADEDCDFEHLIPAARIRDLLLADVFTVEQALNAPTVRLSRDKHEALKGCRLGQQDSRYVAPVSEIFRECLQLSTLPTMAQRLIQIPGPWKTTSATFHIW